MFFLLFLLFIFIVGCETNSPNRINNEVAKETGLYPSDEIMAINSFAVPDSVPQYIDSTALSMAYDLDCDGIRILSALYSSGDSKYYVSFFTDTEGIKEEVLISDEGIQSLSEVDKNQLNKIADNSFLSKELECHDHCWNLAHVYKDASYSGDDFQFSQTAHNNGFFHKVINNLSATNVPCCAGYYHGGLNDCISSHQWANETKCGKRTVVDKLVAYTNTNRNGNYYEFSGTKAHQDDNWEDETYLEWLPTPPYWFPSTINDKASSLDMTYWVYDD